MFILHCASVMTSWSCRSGHPSLPPEASPLGSCRCVQMSVHGHPTTTVCCSRMVYVQDFFWKLGGGGEGEGEIIGFGGDLERRDSNSLMYGHYDLTYSRNLPA